MLVLAAPVLDMRTWPQKRRGQPHQQPDPPRPRPGRRRLRTRRRHSDPVRGRPVAGRRRRGAGAGRRAVGAPRPDGGQPSGAVSRTARSPLVTADARFVDNDERSPGLVADLRAAVPDGVEVTGTTPMFADIAEILSERIWLVIGFVVGISVLLLAAMFRSLVIPLKAAAMNLLSVAAAYGVLTAVFQWGWGVQLLGIDHAMPVSSWLPILMFAILFGLSMDYEVFLLSRVREAYLRTGDPHGSVTSGLASTSRVITSAAAIMVLVFLGFVTEAGTVVKMIGFGMAVAILLDATLVRMVLVPATMSLLGSRNWWLPGWLERVLPEVDVEGRAPVARPAGPVEEPEAEAVPVA